MKYPMESCYGSMCIWSVQAWRREILYEDTECALSRGDCRLAAEYPELYQFPGHTSVSLAEGADPKLCSPQLHNFHSALCWTLAGARVGFQCVPHPLVPPP